MVQKTLLIGSGYVPLVSFDTAKIKIYFESAIISSYFLIIFKKCPASYHQHRRNDKTIASGAFKLIYSNFYKYGFQSGSKYIKNFLTLLSRPLSFNLIYRSVLHRYSHFPTCTSISKRHKSFRQLYIVGMVVPIAPDTSV